MAALLGDSLLLAGVFDDAEIKAIFGLSSFDSEIRQDSSQKCRSLQVGDLPTLQRFTLSSGRLRGKPITAERGEQQIDGVRFDLFDTNALGVGRLGAVTNHAHSVGVPFDSDCSVCVHNSGAVSEGRFVHN